MLEKVEVLSTELVQDGGVEVAIEAVPFVDGYGVEIGRLIDVVQPLAASDVRGGDDSQRPPLCDLVVHHAGCEVPRLAGR